MMEMEMKRYSSCRSIIHGIHSMYTCAHDHQLYSHIHTIQASPFLFTRAWAARKSKYILWGVRVRQEVSVENRRSEVIYTLCQETATLREGMEREAYYVQTPQDRASVIAQQTRWEGRGWQLGEAGTCVQNRGRG